MDCLKDTSWHSNDVQSQTKAIYIDSRLDVYDVTPDDDCDWQVLCSLPRRSLPKVEFDDTGPCKLIFDDDPKYYYNCLRSESGWLRSDMQPHEAIAQKVNLLDTLRDDMCAAIDELTPDNLKERICRKRHDCYAHGCHSFLEIIHSRISPIISAMLPLLESIEDQCDDTAAQEEFHAAFENVLKLDPSITKAAFEDVASKFEVTIDVDASTQNDHLLEFERAGETVLRVHAKVIAGIGGPLEAYVTHSTNQPKPINMDLAPWKACEKGTLQIIAGFAYLGLHRNVRDAIETLEPVQREVLFELLKYLEKEPVGPDCSSSSKLRELKKAVVKCIRQRASELNEDED